MITTARPITAESDRQPTPMATSDHGGERTKHCEFKAERVQYFHLDLPALYGKEDTVVNGKETIYKNVHVCVDRLKDCLPIYGAKAMRLNLVKCLRGQAQSWYTFQLTFFEKGYLCSGEVVDLWSECLINTFKPPTSIALNHFNGCGSRNARRQHRAGVYRRVLQGATSHPMDTRLRRIRTQYSGTGSNGGRVRGNSGH